MPLIQISSVFSNFFGFNSVIANSSIGFIKKLFNEVTSTFVFVKRQFINKKDRLLAQHNILESDLNKHGVEIVDYKL